jgi:hypothetical protein
MATTPPTVPHATINMFNPNRNNVIAHIVHRLTYISSGLREVPFRFLAAVASAAFIALMLGTDSNADQLKCMSLSPDFCSRLVQHQIKTHRLLAQENSDVCQKCIKSYMDKACSCLGQPQDCEVGCLRTGRFFCQQVNQCPDEDSEDK